MLTVILLLSASLLLSLFLNHALWKGQSTLIKEARRERTTWAAERQALIDKTLLQKGYREFAPPQPVSVDIKTEEWEEESLEEGFQPL